jgi:glutamate/tyrosine decarboxylase-like PLP-dependent enzyme
MQDFITPDMTKSKTFEDSMSKMRMELEAVFQILRERSVPFWSPRYGAHMTSDPCLPAVLGYIATMMYNPNNISYEGSPVTTGIEQEVGRQLCSRLRFNFNPELGPVAWGHLTCGGTVANLESIWLVKLTQLPLLQVFQFTNLVIGKLQRSGKSIP